VQGIYLASLDQPKGRRLVATEARGALAGPDVLLFARQGTLFGQRFDVAAGSLIGEPIKLTDQVQFDGALNNIGASASSTGLIAYRVGSPSELLWVDRTGRTLGTVALPDPAPQNCPEISRDDRQVAFDRTIGGNRDIWVAELARGVTRRVTTDSGIDATPVWSPDGTRIAFRSNRSSVNQIYVKPASGTGTEERLPLSDLGVGVSDWVGRTLLFALLDPSTGLDLWAYPFDTGKPFAVAKSGFEERDGQLSTDGRWLAFASNETGRMEVYVQAFPQAGEKWQVSTNGGMQPRWRRDGRELFFVGANGAMMGATVSTRQDGTPIVTGAPVTLFATRLSTVQGGLLRHQYAVTADGQRFLLNSVAEGAATAPITIVVNWHGLHAGP
jgi:hypothetical protein